MTPPNLLTLPAEVRNRIYDYAFEEPSTNLRVTWPASKEHQNLSKEARHIIHEPFQEERPQHINQLQFVCHQLRKETYKLEVQGEPLIFHPTLQQDTSPVWQLKRFMNELGDGRVDWLHSVILVDPDFVNDNPKHRFYYRWLTKHVDNVLEAMKFSGRHQHANVRKVLPYISWNHVRDVARYMFAYLTIIWTFRREDLVDLVKFHHPEIRENFTRISKRILGAKKYKREEVVTSLKGKLERFRFGAMEVGLKEELFCLDANFDKRNYPDRSIELKEETLAAWVHYAMKWEIEGC